MHVRFCRTSTAVDKCDIFTPNVTNGYVIALIAGWLALLFILAGNPKPFECRLSRNRLKACSCF